MADTTASSSSADAAPRRLVIAQLDDNPAGWGPISVPVQETDVPYAPYNKGDKLGKSADWTSNYHRNQFQSRYNQGAGNSVFAYVHTEDDENFTLVDSSSKTKDSRFSRNTRFTRGARGGDRNQRFNTRNDRGRPQRGRNTSQRASSSRRGGARNNFNRRYGGYGDSKRTFEASIEVQPEWTLVEKFEMNSIDATLGIEDGQDLLTCGEIEFMDKAYENLTPKDEKNLERIERAFYSPTTSDDPMIRQLITENAGNVFGTDAIFALLMACQRSVYPWDIVVQRIGGRLIFDKRDNSQIDFVSVNETSNEQAGEERESINSPQSLAQEATTINRYFSQQILVKGTDTVVYDPNPFRSDESEDLASVAYRYRKFNLGDGIELVVRCEIDGVREHKGQNKFLTINALNEYDSKITSWRQKLDTQRGAVLATELKNNSNKLARWILEAILAGADQMVLGYVSRVRAQDPYNHTVLGTQTYVPSEFAQQITLNVKKSWGMLKGIIEKCMLLDDGKYLLMKEPNKAELLIYSVPPDAFEGDMDDEIEDDEELDDSVQDGADE